MKELTAFVVVLLLLVSLNTGCAAHSSKSFTFDVETGDSIKLKLDTSDDYDISSDLPFTISREGKALSQGTFIFAEAYEEYIDAAQSNENVEFLGSGERDGNDYYFWCYYDSEWNYVILINDSNTAIILGNNVSAESAEACFKRLTISVDE